MSCRLACGITSGEDSIELPKRWVYSSPLISPESREDEPSRAQKDPTLVQHEGRWHVFMTVKLPGRSAIEYCSFEDWDNANASKRFSVAAQRQRLLLRAAGVLLPTAQALVPRLSGRPPGFEQDVGGVFDHEQHRGPKFLDPRQTDARWWPGVTRAPWADWIIGSSVMRRARICSSPA